MYRRVYCTTIPTSIVHLGHLPPAVQVYPKGHTSQHQTSNAQLSTEELQHIEEAQKTDEELQEMFSQNEEQLQRKKFRISPQGILYPIEGDRWLIVVPKVLQQKIIRENHDVLAIGHVGLNRTVDHMKRAFWWRGIWSTVGEYL